MKEIFWIGSSKDEISNQPPHVKASFGYRLRQLQSGQTPLDMKRLPQFGRGVCELREAFDGNAYRLVYVLNLKEAIYVLDVFMKKSKSGIGLAKPDVERIKQRLQRALALSKEE